MGRRYTGSLEALASATQPPGASPAGSPAGSFSEGEAEREQRLARERRARGQAAADRIAQLQAQGVQGLEEAHGRGRAGIRQQAAKALAYGLTTGTPVTSGANLAAGQQSALDVGGALGQYDVAAQEALLAQQTQAQQAELAAAQFGAEAGTEFQDYTGALAQAQEDVNDAIERNRHVYGDDEEAMNREIRQIAARQTNPRAKAWVLAQVGKGQAEGGWWNELTGF